jgi:hypothetical protein
MKHLALIMRKPLLIIALLIIPFFATSRETMVLKDSSKTECNITKKDSLNDKTNSFDKFSIKLSSLIVSGEVPLLIEYRPIKNISHEFSIGFDYLVYKLFAPTGNNDFGAGFRIKYGLRIYCHKNEWKNRWWYISPQVFYKQIWIKNRDYSSNGGFFGGSDETWDEYLYKENRQVYGGQLLFGWAKTYRNITREFYLGFGVREIDSYQQITQWLRRSGERGTLTPAEASTMPLTSSLISETPPSIQVGLNISFGVHMKKK